MELDKIRQVQIDPLDTSSREQCFVISYLDRHFEVSAAAEKFIRTAREAQTPEDLRTQYSEITGRFYSAEQIEEIWKCCVGPLLAAETKPPKKPLWIKKDLFSQETVAGLSTRLKRLFAPGIAIPLSVAAVGTNIWFLTTLRGGKMPIEGGFYVLLGVLVFFLVSSSFHELGHASACQYYGISHGAVGFGLYMNFPVFYTDVSQVWKLRRRQRIVVNLAGAYFQLLLMLPLLCIYFQTYSPILRFVLITANLNFLITLNPVFKFDGYWVMADLLGVPNLRSRVMEGFVYLKKKICRQPIKHKPFLWTMKPAEKCVMLVYSLLMNLMFVYYLGYVMPRFIGQFISTFPDLAKQLIIAISQGQTPSFGLLQAIVVQLIFFGLTCFALFRLIYSLVKRYRKKHQVNVAEG